MAPSPSNMRGKAPAWATCPIWSFKSYAATWQRGSSLRRVAQGASLPCVACNAHRVWRQTNVMCQGQSISRLDAANVCKGVPTVNKTEPRRLWTVKRSLPRADTPALTVVATVAAASCRCRQPCPLRRRIAQVSRTNMTERTIKAWSHPAGIAACVMRVHVPW